MVTSSRGGSPGAEVELRLTALPSFSVLGGSGGGCGGVVVVSDVEFVDTLSKKTNYLLKLWFQIGLKDITFSFRVE